MPQGNSIPKMRFELCVTSIAYKPDKRRMQVLQKA
jgi:hypothetical protein